MRLFARLSTLKKYIFPRFCAPSVIPNLHDLLLLWGFRAAEQQLGRCVFRETASNRRCVQGEIIYTLPESVMNVDENRLLDSLDDHFPTTKQLGNSSFITISKSVIPPADSRNGQAVVPDTPLH